MPCLRHSHIPFQQKSFIFLRAIEIAFSLSVLAFQLYWELSRLSFFVHKLHLLYYFFADPTPIHRSPRRNPWMVSHLEGALACGKTNIPTLQILLFWLVRFWWVDGGLQGCTRTCNKLSWGEMTSPVLVIIFTSFFLSKSPFLPILHTFLFLILMFKTRI